MDEYIKRKAVLEKVSFYDQEMINAIPAADVVPVVRAQWIYDNGQLTCTCPICKSEYDTVSCRGPNYCPNCGALMDKDGDGE